MEGIVYPTSLAVKFPILEARALRGADLSDFTQLEQALEYRIFATRTVLHYATTRTRTQRNAVPFACLMCGEGLGRASSNFFRPHHKIKLSHHDHGLDQNDKICRQQNI